VVLVATLGSGLEMGYDDTQADLSTPCLRTGSGLPLRDSSIIVA
jgi:hypothetical protein